MKTTFSSAGSSFLKNFFIVLAMLIWQALRQIVCAADAPTTITDNEIRAVVARVAKHQIHTLADGDYAAFKSVDEAKAAKAPAEIAWSYPWGVALFGMSRSTDVTGDKDADQFVVAHNLIDRKSVV